LPIYQPDMSAPVPDFAPGNPESSEDVDGITWRVERDVARRVTRCVVGSKSHYETPFGFASERYDGWVSVDERTFGQHAHSDVEFVLSFPEVTSTVHSIMDLTTSGNTYEISINLTVKDGSTVIRERTWQQTFPRA